MFSKTLEKGNMSSSQALKKSLGAVENGLRYSYITSTLLSQFGAWLLTGSRSAAYNWQMYYNNSIPWMAWNAEAQAKYIEVHNSLPPWYVWGTGGFLPVP